MKFPKRISKTILGGITAVIGILGDPRVQNIIPPKIAAPVAAVTQAAGVILLAIGSKAGQKRNEKNIHRVSKGLPPVPKP